MTCRGAVGGAAAVAVVFTLGAGGNARDLPIPGNPVEGPGRLRESCSERLASGWKKGSPGTRRPAPGGLLPRPSRAVRGRPQLRLRGCGGNCRRAAPDSPPEDPLEKRERGGSVGQPRGQAAGPRLRSCVLRLARGARPEPATSPRCFCFFLEYATKSRGTVIPHLAFAGKEMMCRGSPSSSLPLPS